MLGLNEYLVSIASQGSIVRSNEIVGGRSPVCAADKLRPLDFECYRDSRLDVWVNRAGLWESENIASWVHEAIYTRESFERLYFAWKREK